jgi:hypothetical protein
VDLERLGGLSSRLHLDLDINGHCDLIPPAEEVRRLESEELEILERLEEAVRVLLAHARLVDRYPVSGRILVPIDVVSELIEYGRDVPTAERVINGFDAFHVAHGPCCRPIVGACGVRLWRRGPRQDKPMAVKHSGGAPRLSLLLRARRSSVCALTATR